MTFQLIAFQSGQKGHVKMQVPTSAKAEKLERRLKMLIVIVTAPDEAEEAVIRQSVWAVIVQDEPQQ